MDDAVHLLRSGLVIESIQVDCRYRTVLYLALTCGDGQSRPIHPVQEDEDNGPPNLSVSRPRCSSRRPPFLRQHYTTDLACALPLRRHFCLLLIAEKTSEPDQPIVSMTIKNACGYSAKTPLRSP